MPEATTRSNLTPEQRSLRARVAAFTLHGRGGTNVGPANDARLAKFEALADPDGTLDPAERRRRAEHLRRAEMARLALLSSKARRARKGAQK